MPPFTPSPTHPTPEQPTTHSSLKLAILIVLIIGVSTILFFTARSLRVSVIDWASHGGLAAVSMANCTIADVLGNWGPAKALSPGNCNGDDMVDGMDLALALSGGTPDPDGGDETEDPVEEGSEEEENPSEPVIVNNDELFLINGNDSSSTPNNPENIGNADDEGFTAKAIARWTTVPFQMIQNGEDIRVSLIAFHINGIDHVSFRANGGPWVESTQMQVNPSTGVAEYWARLRASDFPDGKVDIQAIIYPKNAGKPLVLAGPYQANLDGVPYFNGVYSLILWTNANGSLSRNPVYVSGSGNDTTGDGSLNNPYLTLSKAAEKIQNQYGSVDGATIFCLPGEYDFQMKWSSAGIFAKANDRFITITPAPGVSREQVIIEEARPKTARIHLKNVTLKTNATANFYTGYSSPRTILWLDGIKVSALAGRYTTGGTDIIGTASYYVTDSIWTDTPNGPINAILVRNTEVTKLKSDMFSGVQTLVNSWGSDIDAANTGAHPDIYQIYKEGTENGTGNTKMDNYIVYGLKADNFKAQGIFIAALGTGEIIKNSAFINISLNPIPTVFTTQINKPIENVIWAGNTLKQTFFLRAKPQDNNSFKGNIFSAVTLDLPKVSPSEAAEIDWEDNHFVASPPEYGTYTFGSDVTTGPAPVLDWANGNFKPQAGSILTNRLSPFYSIHDVLKNIRKNVTAVGAWEE